MNRLRGSNGKSDDSEDFASIEIGHLGVSIPAGQYRAYCRAAKTYRDGGYKRWVCLLDFDIYSDGLELMAKLPMWLNLGPGQKPKVTRRSRYLEEWVKAAGVPSRMDRSLTPRVFLHRWCRVAVDSTAGVMPRSVVREILEWETGQVKSSTLASAEGSTQQTTRPADAVQKNEQRPQRHDSVAICSKCKNTGTWEHKGHRKILYCWCPIGVELQKREYAADGTWKPEQALSRGVAAD